MTIANAPTSPTKRPSLRNAKPVEQGGPIARSGFNYQDEVAVGFFIEMLEAPAIEEVRCETHDDIVLMRSHGQAGPEAEFVQVKADVLGQLWSVSNLCERPKGIPGTSIFETSLSKDQYAERSKFRVVTLQQVNKALTALTYPFKSNGRVPDGAAIKALCAELETRCAGAKSENGNGHAYWLDNCTWDVRHDEKTVRKENAHRLLVLSIKEGRGLLPETVETLLLELRARAKDAGAAKWDPDPEIKVVSRTQIREWWDRRTREMAEGASSSSGGKLRGKMRDANFPTDMVALALEIRRNYGEVSRSSRYMESAEAEKLRQRVQTEAMSLRSQYASGALDVDGVKFHALLLERLAAINAARGEMDEDRSAFLQGCMYDIADRCLLQFAKVRR